MEELLDRFFKRCKEENVQISEKKFKSKTQLKFGGSIIDTENDEVRIKPDEEEVNRIRNFPAQRQEPNLVRLSSEMAKLHNEKNTFTWTQEH